MNQVGGRNAGNDEVFNFKMLLTAVFNWAYNNDLDLYKNLDSTFEAFECRSGLSQEQTKQIYNYAIPDQQTVIKLLSKAITLADYHDTLKFSWTFITNNNSTNKGHGSYEWKYSSFVSHPYSELIPLIKAQMELLEEKGLNSWSKSIDIEKHTHFRWWMNHFLEVDRAISLRFFVQHTGNVQSFDTLYVGTNQNEAYHAIIQFILDQNIVPDPCYKSLDVPDFVNPDHYNPRPIKSSGRFGGFNYLVYLTGRELKEIYKTKIVEDDLNYMEKAIWSYINATIMEKETRFYLFFT
jgi:hypothetical protein